MKYRDLISGSLRLLGVVGQGQTARGQEIVDGLNVLNEFIDSLNVAGTILWADTSSIHTTPVFTAPQTNITSAFYTSNGINYPLAVVDADFINGIPDRTITGVPAVIYSDNQFPNSTFTVYPTPSSGSVTIVFKAKLGVVTLDDVVTVPPAFQRMLRYNLAASIAPEYGLEAPAGVQRIALDTLDAVQKNGFVPPIMEFDIQTRAIYNINRDE